MASLHHCFSNRPSFCGSEVKPYLKPGLHGEYNWNELPKDGNMALQYQVIENEL